MRFTSYPLFILSLTPIRVHICTPRWTGLLEEISERLRSSKALLQLWQRYKELHERSRGSSQLQEEKAHRLLKLACSKDIADEEVADWIQECSVSEASLSARYQSLCFNCVSPLLYMFFVPVVSGGAPVSSSSAGLLAGPSTAGRAAEAAGGHVSSVRHPVGSPLAHPAAGCCGTGTNQAAHHAAGTHTALHLVGIQVVHFVHLLTAHIRLLPH